MSSSHPAYFKQTGILDSLFPCNLLDYRFTPNRKLQDQDILDSHVHIFTQTLQSNMDLIEFCSPIFAHFN